MVFSSNIFLFYFLPIVLLVYYLIPQKGKNIALTLFSYLFYGWANPLFVLLMFFSTVVDYFCGLFISETWGRSSKIQLTILEKGSKRSGTQKVALVVSIVVNLSLLGFFKYFNFGVENYNALMSALGAESMQYDTFFRVVLPLGISFYTFQTMSYSIDVYRGDAMAIRRFVDFSCFVSMFPQLVAGPIIRFQEVDEQLRKRSHTIEKFARGVAFFVLGFGKKILIANVCGKIADMAFNANGLSAFDAWYGVIAYAFQIYFDFSAYTDMAIGLGLMLGFVFPKNFDSPYSSKSITEFWRRWHQSLSTWLRDYLYIPLGGNRKGNVRAYINLALVMLLGGLWHGASWNFLIWGSFHGGLLVIERLAGKDSLYKRLPAVIQIIITFVLVLFSWVFFRADNLTISWQYFHNMFGTGYVNPASGLIHAITYNGYYIFTFVLAALIVWFAPQTWDFSRKITWQKAVYMCGVFLISILVLTTQSFNPFIYFMF